ncbi:D-2-hydroxyacid dehydrogenase [Xanthobacter autotrophicus]|uniref:D-2-hydroxyacid dehydrogenase n=1 Tax=Xanthobacter autotrophicus TaxID=280 RepID=UPI00372B9E5D
MNAPFPPEGRAPRIVFLDRETLAPAVTLKRPAFAHDWVEYDRTAPAELMERARDADILILNKVRLDAGAIARLPRLALVAVAATGTDCVDKAACAAAGIVVSNVRGYAKASVPEHTFALILALSRAIVPYAADVKAGAWQAAGQFCFHTHPIIDLHGRRLGIFGSGDLGQQVAALGRAFGMEPVFADRKGATAARPGYLPFAEVIETADVLTLHCPLTPETRGLIGAPEFARMGRRPILVNTARGGLVDEAALVAALDAGQVAGAGIDVAMPEPPPADSAVMRLAHHPKAIVTPHVAWASIEAQQALADQLIANIEAFAAGRPVNLASA